MVPGEQQGLPQLPRPQPKPTTRSSYLTFRVPGDKISKTRLEAIEGKITALKERQNELKNDQRALWESCRHELSNVSIRLGGKNLYDSCQEHLQAVAQGLAQAIAPSLEFKIDRRNDLQKNHGHINEVLEMENRAIERYTLERRDLQRQLETHQQEITQTDNSIDKIQKRMQKGSEDTTSPSEAANDNSGVKESSSSGIYEEVQKWYEYVDGENQGAQLGDNNEQNERNNHNEEGDENARTSGSTGVERQADDGSYRRPGPTNDLGITTENDLRNRNTGMKRKPPLSRRRKEIELERERLQYLDSQKARKTVLETEVKDILKEIGSTTEILKSANERKIRLEIERKRLEESIKNKHGDDITDIERIKEGEVREKKRKRELDDQIGRNDGLNCLRKKLRAYQSYFAKMTSNELNEENHSHDVQKEGELKEVEEVLRKVEKLEEKFADVFKSKEQLKEVQDLIVVFKREKLVEEVIGEGLKGPQESTPEQQDSHLSTNMFAYGGLCSGQIRLLKIWPAPDLSYPLICSLETHTLEDSSSETLKYAALSYYWGDEYPQANIYLRHDNENTDPPNTDNWGSTARFARRHAVRINLFRALLRLRHEKEAVTLWVDFLCINQDSLDEKTDQLRKMVKIYRGAESVRVWLGEGDDEDICNSDKAMDFIEKVKDFAMLDTYVKDEELADEWLSIAELMRDRWFSRRWVVQEIALARKATLHCGSKTVPWSDFVDAASILVSNQANIRLLFNPKKWRDGSKSLGEVQSYGASILIEEMSNLFQRAEDGTIIKPIKSLESLVTSLKTFDTSDERDFIYSLIFIAYDTYKDSGGSGGYTKGMIDYGKTTAEVYTDFIQFCLGSAISKPNSEYPLDIICRPWAMPAKRATRRAVKDLPSWIALLKNSEFGEPDYVYRGRKNGETFVGPAGQPRYRASGNKECKSEFVRSSLEVDLNQRGHSEAMGKEATENLENEQFPSYLLVRGFILGMVNDVSPKNTGGLIHRESLAMGDWKGIQNMTNDENVPDKIWRTLVGNQDSRYRALPTWYQGACLRCLEMADNFNGGDLNVGQLLQSAGDSGMVYTYLTRVRNTVWGRRFFTATTEKPIGNGGEQAVAAKPLAEGGDTISVGDSEERIPGEDVDISRVTSEEPMGEEDVPAVPSEEPVGRELRPTAPISQATETACTSIEGEHFHLKDIYGDNKSNDPAEITTTQLFGLCPEATKNDDLLCILYGCSVPVILRPKGKPLPGKNQQSYMVVGEAYVHGKMDGEAIDSLKAKKVFDAEQDFHLV
ncbi:hypothetical protein TWF730_004435 [Orbilia blumenaviensis]|uniref:Heterokaryon incompatibility domain-containing protein n=1 Tax=Orbilia blumenaviensis TaxID=1796055 RepID=A0AAV9U0Y1_9PEZI